MEFGTHKKKMYEVSIIITLFFQMGKLKLEEVTFTTDTSLVIGRG